MNTKGAVLALLVVVTLLGCVNAGGKKCKLYCPKGQQLIKDACKCKPTVVECPLLNCLATEPPCNVYKTNPITGCRTCECSSISSPCPLEDQYPCDVTQACPDGKVLNITACRCIPKPLCPLLKCQGLSPPCLSYLRNDNGCQTCQCAYRCPVRNCSTNCAYGVESFVANDGCTSCRCKQPPNCKPSECGLYCAEGYEKDSYGCDKCQCRLCGNLCKIGCPNGKLVDFDGCQVCECKPKSECGPVCSNATCENGRVYDGQGCPTCQCVKRCECGPVCFNECTYQRLYDKYGCQTCTCLSPP